MTRQTVRLRKLIDDANAYLQNTANDRKNERQAIQRFVEKQLMDAGVYAGFNYVDGWPCKDETRIYFYYSHKLK